MAPELKVRVGRDGRRWFAVSLVETPWGPVVLTAVGNERAVYHALLRRFREEHGAVVGAHVGLWGALKKVAKKAATAITKSSVVRNVASQAKAIAKNPIVATAIKLHTTPLKLASKALKGVTNNPLWNVAATGASFIPGVGSAVSAGMAAAAALGRGASLKDAALAAAKSALPGGPLAKAAFDVAMGVAHGQRIDQIALNTVRNQLPGGPLARAGFDAALNVVKTKSLKGVPALMAKAAVEQAGKGPLWDKLATGAQIIPGLGSTGSAGMAGAVALGKRLGVTNLALSAARSALPASGPMRAAFDAGLGVAQGKRLDAAALNVVREQLPRGAAVQAAFNTALTLGRAKPGDVRALKTLQQSLPSGPIGQNLTRIAAKTMKRRVAASEQGSALAAATEIVRRVQQGDEEARARVHQVLQRAREGDAVAKVAARALRAATRKAQVMVTSKDALASSRAASQAASDTGAQPSWGSPPAWAPAAPPAPPPWSAPAWGPQPAGGGPPAWGPPAPTWGPVPASATDAVGPGLDGTDTLIESMTPQLPPASCPGCGQAAA